MNYIIKKAGVSLVVGAASMLGTWSTKQFLDGMKKYVDTQKDKKDSNKETAPV